MITGNWIVDEPRRRQHAASGSSRCRRWTRATRPSSTGGAGFPLSIAAGTRAPRRRGRLHRLDDERSRERPAAPDRRRSRCTTASHPPIQPGTVLADVVNAARTVIEGNGVVPYEDWATPTFYDTLTVGDPGADGEPATHRSSSWPTSKPTTKTSRARGADGRSQPDVVSGAVASSASAAAGRGRGDRDAERLPGEARRIALPVHRAGVHPVRRVQPLAARPGREHLAVPLGRHHARARGWGCRNYSDFFTDPLIREGYLHVLQLMVFYAFLPIVLGLFLAAVLSRIRIRGLTVVPARCCSCRS